MHRQTSKEKKYLEINFLVRYGINKEGDLAGEDWDNKQLNDIFLHKDGKTMYCFTRE